MSIRPKALFSGAMLSVLALLSFTLSVFALFIGLTLSERIDSSNHNVEPAPVAHIRESGQIVRISPLLSSAYSETEFEDFTRRLVVEYITMRYTINGSRFLMDRALGIYSDEGGTPMKVLSRFDAYDRFTADEASGIIALMNAGVTRSVKVLEGPRRHADRWITKVEFIHRDPATLNLESARREYWEIHMEVEDVARFREMSPTLSPTILQYPSTIFGFRVNWLGRYESREI